MSRQVRTAILRFGGGLLVVLGTLHLAVTPFIARMLSSSMPAASSEWLSPPMLLNHVVVGVLLMPLGVLTFFAAVHAAAEMPWALVVVRTTAVAVGALPVALIAFMGARYFEAVPFVVATAIVCLASVVLLSAAFWPAANADT